MRYRDDAVSVSWVDSDKGLGEACARFDSIIALDTEFMRTNTYYPVPGLYQIAHGDEVVLIDPQAISLWEPLCEVLVDSNVVKIMHACLEDLELLHHHLGVQLRNVFDTQYANAFVTEKFSLSYAGLVNEQLGVELAKHETRSNWLQRPLSSEQVEYAVEDVIFLERLYEKLNTELEQLDRREWFADDMKEREHYVPVDPSSYYRGLKRGWQLSAAQLKIFQQLVRWREETAQQENVPRNRVVWDEHLFKFARISDLAESHIRAALPGRVAKKYGPGLLAAAQESSSLDLQPIPTPLNSSQGLLVKELRSVGLDKAAKLNLAPELLCRKKDLEACVRSFALNGELTPLFSTWRFRIIGSHYLDVLARKTSDSAQL